MLNGVILNADVLRKLKPFTAGRTSGKAAIRGIYIEDSYSGRTYAATNGQILACYSDPTPPGEKLINPVVLLITQRIKAKSENFILKDIDENTALLVSEAEKIAVDLMDAKKYPLFRQAIPNDSTPEAEDYAIFKAAYLSKLSAVIKSEFKPKMRDAQSPALWAADGWRVVIHPIADKEIDIQA